MSLSFATADVSYNPRTAEQQDGVEHTATPEVERLLHVAASAAAEIAATSPRDRQRWLNAVAETLLSHQEELAKLAEEETALGLPRLRAEIAGAARSAQFYASVAVDGDYLGASAETMNESTTLARWNIPVGPVAVFGASNFPFGFGVCGHDVASAIAAGCPVVVKAHPAHPRLSVRLANLTREAFVSAGAPAGVYDLVVGFAAGIQLVDSPEIMAVAFTGSQGGGMALRDRAAARGVPVFAEMGTVNPVFVTAAAIASPRQTDAIAAGFVASFTLGAGQFCTKPGLILAPAGSGLFAAVKNLVTQLPPAPLLSPGIATNFAAGVDELAQATGSPAPADELRGNFAVARVFAVDMEDLKPGSRLLDECFGPVALVCEYADSATALEAVGGLQNSLAASVFTGGPADAESTDVVSRLLTKVGRVSINAWPTGVANTWSQQHGGPWPATSQPQATSVGAGALARFVRPVALQNAEPDMLPPAVAPENPWNIPRRVNGIFAVSPS
ncbi:aldehyde dehydrogenase family protein [Cryobacterium psychrophilum]|uniref:Aldehyde dehydrogenase family protein n=1 Tax=Cryobacterium psychrophilum TaxID=41988 RepID=A0A4Y8KWR2_9MICO|nr:aldehyde dehydrogenase family protein [Cryobacterium psychrophilum]TDW28774.1 NADP-dependent aldehyde dehydrogenase [Cryobacterium psychrophilum]TFD82425.1 aldehyde dehydrogenase family protein [Cryobacterium psychrophilum]